MECKECGQTHAVLPFVVLPHSQFSVQFVIQLMYAYIVHKYASVEKMCQAYDIAITTFYRLLHRFIQDGKAMLNLMRNCFGRMEDMLKQLVLCSMIELDKWMKKFYNQYHYGFMLGNKEKMT